MSLVAEDAMCPASVLEELGIRPPATQVGGGPIP